MSRSIEKTNRLWTDLQSDIVVDFLHNAEANLNRLNIQADKITVHHAEDIKAAVRRILRALRDNLRQQLQDIVDTEEYLSSNTRAYLVRLLQNTNAES